MKNWFQDRCNCWQFLCCAYWYENMYIKSQLPILFTIFTLRYSERMDRAFSSPLADWEIKTKPSAYSKPDTFAIIEEFCSLIRNFYWAFSFRTKIFNQVIKFVADIVLEEFVKEAIHHAKLNQKLSWNQWSRCIVYLLSHDSSTCRLGFINWKCDQMYDDVAKSQFELDVECFDQHDSLVLY